MNLVPHQRLTVSVPKKSISEIAEVLLQQQQHKGSQADILENVQMTTERGCLEDVSLHSGTCRSINNERDGWMDTDIFPPKRTCTLAF